MGVVNSPGVGLLGGVVVRVHGSARHVGLLLLLFGLALGLVILIGAVPVGRLVRGGRAVAVAAGCLCRCSTTASAGVFLVYFIQRIKQTDAEEACESKLCSAVCGSESLL